MTVVLFKYRSMATPEAKEHTLDIFVNHRLFCPAPESFNDPFECQAKISFEAPLSEKNALAKKHLMSESPAMTEAEAKRLAPARWQQAEKRDFPSIRRSILNAIGVVSFSTIKDDILMWSHYAGGHNGICIEFSCTNESHVDFVGQALEVHYQQDFPIAKFYATDMSEKITAAKALILTKAEHWKYEQEWRIIRDVSGNSRYLTLPKGIISAIYFGCKISDENRDEVLRSHGSFSRISPRRLLAPGRTDSFARSRFRTDGRQAPFPL